MSRILLGMLVLVFVRAGVPVVVAADETLERRWGPKIKEKGIFRDAARSSQKYTVYSSGLRWVSMMLLVAVPWSQRVWALPFLTVLAPGEKTNDCITYRRLSKRAGMDKVENRGLSKRKGRISNEPTSNTG